jgi:DNA-binding protein
MQIMFLLVAASISQAHFCEEIVVTKEGINQVVYNAEGKKIASSFSFTEPQIYQSGFVIVKEGISWIVYNTEGKKIASSFAEPQIYQNGFAIVKEGINQVVYNAEGKKIASSFAEPQIYKNGFAIVKEAQLGKTCDKLNHKSHQQKQHYNRKRK